MVNFFKSIIFWLFVKENRKVGLKYTKKALDIASKISELTDTKKDDEIIAFLNKQLKKAMILNNITGNEVVEISKKITNISKGNLKDVSINVEDGSIGLSIGNSKIGFDSKGFKFGFSL